MLPLKQQIEKELRQSFELAYREKLLVMKNHYQMRYQTLHETINNSYKRILQDQVLSAMTRDTTTVNFLEERVKELYKQIVQNQREVIIQKLGLQYSQLRFQYLQLQKKYSTIKKQTESLSQKQLQDRLSSQQNKSSLSSTLHKKQQQIFQLKLQLKQQQTLQKQKQTQLLTFQNKAQELQKQNIMLTNKLLSMDEQLKQTIGVVHTNIQLKDVDVKESQNKVYNLEKTVKDMERNWQTQVRLVEDKCRKKIDMYKDKIEQYKAKILELVSQRENLQDNRLAEAKIQELEKKIMSMGRQSEKKMSQLKATRQKDKIQMQRKYESKYRQLQSYYQKLIQQKLSQSQKIAQQAAQRIQHEQHEIRRYIHYLQQNSTPLSQYTKLQQFTQNLKQHLEQKLLQHQKVVTNYISQNKHQQQRLKDTVKLLAESEDKCEQFEKIVQELQGKIKMYEQQLGSLKMGEKKLKALLADCQTGLRSREEEVVGLRAELQKVRTENVENMGMLGQRQALYLQKCQQVQTLQKRLSRHTNQTQLLNQQFLNLQNLITSLKKSLSQKQNQIQTITQDNQFKIQNLNSQIHKNSISLQSANEKIQDLSQKCNTLENTLTLTNKQRMEIQANLRKMELENKFVKESEVSFREQHQMYVLEFKKKMEEKCRIVEQLHNQIVGLKKCHSQQLQNQQLKIRKLTMTLKRVHRIYSSQIDNLSRSIKDMRIYMESTEKLLRSEIKMMQNNAYLRVKQEMFLIMSNKNDEIRKIKQALQHDKNQHNDANKTKLQKFEVSMKQKLQQQIRNYETLVSNKDKQIQKLQRDHKKQTHEMCQQNEKNQNLQKKIKALELAYQNQRIQSKSKINQLIRNFDQEKNKLLEEYDRKQQKLEAQLEELIKSVKVLRRELENSKSVGEEQKGRYSQEVERLNRRERELEMELQKKKLQIINLNECLKMSRQSNTKQQSQLKSMSQKCLTLTHSLTQLQFQTQTLQNQQTIQKSRIDRYSTQNEQLKRQLTQVTEQKNKLEQNKIKLEHQLKQIRGNIIKSNKSQDLRALQLLDIQTRELSNKVNQLRKVNFNMDKGNEQKTPLRF